MDGISILFYLGSLLWMASCAVLYWWISVQVKIRKLFEIQISSVRHSYNFNKGIFFDTWLLRGNGIHQLNPKGVVTVGGLAVTGNTHKIWIFMNRPFATVTWWRRAITASYGPLARYVKLRVAHAPGMPGRFSPPKRVSDLDMSHGTCVPWCLTGSWTSSFLLSRWRGKRSHYSRRMHYTQFYVSGKRPILSVFAPHQWILVALCWIAALICPSLI